MSGPSAFIDMREIARVEAFWWVGGPGEKGVMDGDWMAIIYRPMGGGTDLKLKYRFRHYKDERVFHSDDERSSYRAEIPKAKLAEAIEAVDDMAKMALDLFGGKIYRKRFVEGNRARFQRWLIEQPFANLQSQAEHDRTRPQ